MDAQLQTLLHDLKSLRKALKAERVEQIAKKALRESARDLGTRWHREIAPSLSPAGFAKDVCDRYTAGFTRLIKLSSPSNKRTAYLAVLDSLIRTFRDDLLIPAEQGAFSGAAPSVFDAFFASLPNPDESSYLAEAVACAKAGFLRAAAVLGWSAAVDRIHRKVELVGFAAFNVTSAQMASQKVGRFKRFGQTQNVNSVSELREVFDTVVLWILEGIGLIDSNQHTRLRSCFEMRCQSAHPGDAPITAFNLMSFFSDIDQIILSNPKFAVQPPSN